MLGNLMMPHCWNSLQRIWYRLLFKNKCHKNQPKIPHWLPCAWSQASSCWVIFTMSSFSENTSILPTTSHENRSTATTTFCKELRLTKSVRDCRGNCPITTQPRRQHSKRRSQSSGCGTFKRGKAWKPNVNLKCFSCPMLNTLHLARPRLGAVSKSIVHERLGLTKPVAARYPPGIGVLKSKVGHCFGSGGAIRLSYKRAASLCL